MFDQEVHGEQLKGTCMVKRILIVELASQGSFRAAAQLVVAN